MIYSWSSRNCLGHETLELPHQQRVLSLIALLPFHPCLAHCLVGGSIESQSMHWKRDVGSELLGDLVWDQGDHPDGQPQEETENVEKGSTQWASGPRSWEHHHSNSWMIAFTVYSQRVKIIFVATVGGESNTSIEQMWEVLCPPARGDPVLFSQIVGKCTGTVYRLKEGKYGST